MEEVLGDLETHLLQTSLVARIAAHGDSPAGDGILKLLRRAVTYVEQTMGVRRPPSHFLVLHPRSAARALRFNGSGRTAFFVTSGLVNQLIGLSTVVAAYADLGFNAGFDWYYARRADGLADAAAADPLLGTFERRQLGRRLFQHALSSIALHEIGHVVNGHLALFPGARDVVLSEAELPEVADEMLTRRALEFDADAFAAQHTVRLAMADASDPQPGEDRRAEAWLGLFIAHLIFEIYDPPDSESTPHQSAAIRLRHSIGILMLVETLRSEAIGDPVPTSKPFWDQVLRREQALSHFRLRSRHFVEYAATGVRDQHGRWAAQMLARWALIRPDLTKLKDGIHNLAPAQVAPA